MLSVGALAFAAPFFLIALIALPILWWLLRATPPAPKRVAFPAVRVLLGLQDEERTPQRTPWWLLLLRIAAAALLIFAFADPLLNPKPRLAGDGPLLVVMDGGWGSAAEWEERRAAARDFIEQADRAERPVALVSLGAAEPAAAAIAFGPAGAALEQLGAAAPQPWRPDPTRLDAALTETDPARLDNIETVWLQDGLAVEGDAALATRLAELGPLRVIGPETAPLALRPPEIRDGALIATVLRAEPGPAITVKVAAFGVARAIDPEAETGAEASEADAATASNANASAAARLAGPIDGDSRLATVDAVFEEGALTAEAEFRLPIELRNGLSRLEIVGAEHAGAVALLDARWRRRTIALVSGEAGENRLALLSGAHYLKAALEPHAAYRETSLRDALGLGEPDLLTTAAEIEVGPEAAADADDAGAASWADAIILSDIGRIDPETEAALIAWVEQGGLLVRFAGPRLAAFAEEEGRQVGRPAENALLPVRLRGGGRALGGALSWSAAQGLSAFSDDGPFAGLTTPEEVTVKRQVLAEPGPELTGRVWATLEDGTPLVTSTALGEGRVVLFHVTASPAWSTLPLSGLFVDMMERLASAAPALAARADRLADDAEVWAPERLMTAFGDLDRAPDDAQPLPSDALAAGVRTGVAPGVYLTVGEDGAEARLAVSALAEGAEIAPRAAAPDAALVETLGPGRETALKPWLMAGALGLLSLDILAALFLAGRLRGAAALLAVGVLSLGLAGGGPAAAQTLAQTGSDTIEAAPAEVEPERAAEPERVIDPAEARGALETVLAYVVTGDAEVDRTSAAGMLGLSVTLFQRTAVEPGEAAAIDLETDELAVYAIIYWPITSRQPDLSPRATRKLNEFMRSGGLLIVDTRDAHQTFGAGQGPNSPHLQRLLAGLDLPPLEPIPRDHVLTRSFYIIDELPGRHRGGRVWIEAAPRAELDGQTLINENDGVSPIIIGSVDWAGAWAIDDRGEPMRPMGSGGERQREIAFRFGVNLAMYAFTGNYKSDQVHLPALLERLGN